MSTYLILSIIGIVGAILQASIGFGFPIFAMIFLVMVFPFSTAVTICQFSGILGVGYLFFKYIKRVQWRTLIPFLSTALLVGLFLAWYSTNLPVVQLKMWLGIVLILISVFFFFSEKTFIKPNAFVGSISGVISGLLNGLFSIGGPPVALYLLPSIEDKISYIATANAYFFIFKCFSLPIRFMNGSVTKNHIGYLLVSMISMTIGTLIGDRVMQKIPKKALKKIVYIFVALSGAVIVFQQI